MKNIKEIKVDKQSVYFNKTSIFSLHELYFSDLEGKECYEVEKELSHLFEEYKGIRFRFIYKNYFESLFFEKGVRRDYLNRSPQIKQKLYLSIEKDLSIKDLFSINFSKKAKSFINLLSLRSYPKLFKKTYIEINETLKDLVENEVKDYKKPFLKLKNEENIGLIKLKTPKDSAISLESLSTFKAISLPGTKIILTITQKSKEESLRILKKRSDRSSIKEGLTGLKKKSEIDETLSEIELRSGVLCEYDLNILISLNTEDETVLKSIKQGLSAIGDFEVDYFGAYSSFNSTLLGQRPNYSLLEESKCLYPLVPIFTFGAEDQDVYECRDDDIVFKRRDSSLFNFNLFNKKQNANNTLIIGQTGLGKSMFTGLLISALAENDNNIVKILDVGSSHEDTVKKCNGVINSLSLDRPSGMNPFRYVHFENISIEQKSEILSKFVEALLLEPKENEIKIEEKSLLEDCMLDFLKKWLKSDHQRVCTLNDFITHQKEKVPRFKSLKRFSHEGVYHNVFKEDLKISDFLENQDDNKITYFDFKEITQASDTSFSGAGIAGLVSEFSLSVLSNKEKRKILIIEECKFFIENKFNFLKFGASNIRKYGGAICLVTQNYSDLVPQGDYSLVTQFQNKFFFSLDKIDGEKSVVGLTDKDVRLIESLDYQKGVHSQVLLKTPDSNQILHIDLTPEEYMRLTTDHDDKKLFYKLDDLGVGLSGEEKIRLLSNLRDMGKI